MQHAYISLCVSKCKFSGCTCQNHIRGHRVGKILLCSVRSHLIICYINNFSNATPSNNSMRNPTSQFSTLENMPAPQTTPTLISIGNLQLISEFSQSLTSIAPSSNANLHTLSSDFNCRLKKLGPARKVQAEISFYLCSNIFSTRFREEMDSDHCTMTGWFFKVKFTNSKDDAAL